MINVEQTRLADREAAALHVGSDRRDVCLLFTGVFAALLPPPMYSARRGHRTGAQGVKTGEQTRQSFTSVGFQPEEQIICLNLWSKSRFVTLSSNIK